MPETGFSTERLPLNALRQYPALLLDYIDQKPALKPFYDLFPSPEAYAQMAERRRNFSPESRAVLKAVLEEQYKGIELTPAEADNISAVTEQNAFTITTGHQLNIFTGPLYTVLKIQTVIILAREMNALYPQYKFIPLWWMATEDHDFEEINHLHLFGKKFTWESLQSGCVGSFSTEGMAELMALIPDLPEAFRMAYAESETLADATRKLAHHLFGTQGLLVLDPDDARLKTQFTDIAEDELLNGTAFRIAGETSEALKNAGWKPQVHVRELNLFWKDTGLRERIVRNGDNDWQVLNTDITFNRESLLEKLNASPEHFSPNVLLRPLYEERILPNLGYIGGPAEMVYWMQLKPLFEHYKLSFPILHPRIFAGIVSRAQNARMQKLGFSFSDLAQDESVLKQQYLESQQLETPDTLREEQMLTEIFNSIGKKAGNVDKTLTEYVMAEKTKAEKLLEGVIKRIRKAEEKKHETGLNQVLNLRQKLMPDGGLQERKENILNFLVNSPGIMYALTDLQGFDFSFRVIRENG